jgi:hypothetical protein
MITMKKIMIMMAMLSIAFVSCKKEDDSSDDNNTTPTPTNTNFAFIKQGASWTYVNSDTDPNHAGVTFESSYVITAKDAAGWCNVNWIMPSITVPMEWYADNNEWADTGSKMGGTKFTIIKATPVLNDEYSMTYDDNGTPVTNTRKVINLKDTVTVGAGTFTNCVVIHETTTADPVYYKDYWIDLNSGIVRMEGTTTGDYPVIIIQELK